jgi:hypothetical protein
MKVHPVTLPAFGSLIVGQAGIFAAIMRGPVVGGIEQPPYALLVSEKPAGEFQSRWGEYGKDIAGTASRIDGKANTEAMAAAACPAVLQIHGKDIAGHADWYLPSLGELNSAAANVPEQFDPKGVYWTSTQTSRDSAFAQYFEYGGSGWGSKGSEFRVRAFRRIPLDHLNA